MNALSTSSVALIVLGFVAAANLLLGAIMYFGDVKSITRKYFFLLTLSVTLFNGLTYIAYRVNDVQLAIWVLRLVLVSAVPFAVYFYLLVRNFPSDTSLISKRWQRVINIWSIAVVVVALTPLVFKNAVLVDDFVQATPGPGILIFTLTVLFFDISGLWLSFKYAFKAKAGERAQNYLLLFGFLTMKFLTIAFNFVLPAFFQKTELIPYSMTFSLPFVILTAYAIVRHRLLNIKVIATEVFIFLLVMATLLQTFFSQDIFSIIFRLSIFLLVLAFSLLLIRSVRREVQQREELQKLSAALKNANDQLVQVDKAKSEFLSVASHQLRTPLTAIKGYTSMFLSGDFGKVTDPQRQNLQIIYDSAHRLAVLVSDLLDLSRIESGRMEFDFKAVNLCKIVESVINEVTPKATERKLYVYFDNVNRTCPNVRADEEKIRQVIINLIDNAIKYTLQGGVIIRLMQTAEGQLQFSVTDTGIGVDPKEKDKLFEKFFRTQAANEVTREGTGLGIYVVKKIVAAHGGKIWFDSPGVNKGTTFYFTLPIPKGAIKEEKVKIDSLDAF